MKKIRVLIAIMGMDQHEVGAIAVCRMLRDAGMEIIYLSKFNLPASIVDACLEEDVDLIGLSCHSWEYLDYLPELFARLRANNMDIPVVLGGSVITPADMAALRAMGVSAVFTTGARQSEIVQTIRGLFSDGASQ